MSATMARQGGRVQLEQSDMRLALNMANMSKGAIEETQQLIKKPRAEVPEENIRGVEFPSHQMMNTAIETHPAMVYKNQTDGCLPCQIGKAKNPQTLWSRKETAADLPDLAALPPGTPPSPGTPCAPPGLTDRHESSEIEGMPSLCVYIHFSHPNTPFFNHNAYAKDSKHNEDFIPDLLSTLFATWKYC